MLKKIFYAWLCLIALALTSNLFFSDPPKGVSATQANEDGIENSTNQTEHSVVSDTTIETSQIQSDILDLSGLGLLNLPPITKSIETLILDDNDLESLPDSVCELKNLKRLSVRNNQLITLPKLISQLTQLEELDLSGNDIDTLPEEFWSLTQLKVLRIETSFASERYASNALLTADFNTLTNLEELHLSGVFVSLESTSARILPILFGNMRKLKRLSLRNNNIVRISSTIGHLQNLEQLTISDNKLPGYPEIINQLSNLVYLDLSINFNIDSIPTSISRLRRLETLDLERTNVADLGTGFRLLQSLRELNLPHATDKQEFDGLWKLSNLRSLQIDWCPDKIVPSGLTRLIGLEELKIETPIKSFPYGFSKLQKLKALDLSGSALIASLPKELAKLPNLRSLNLADCYLKELPDVVTEIRSLRELDISKNGFSSLPSEFWELGLTSLKMTTLTHFFSEAFDRHTIRLDKNIGRLTDLVNLDLSGTIAPLTEEALNAIGSLPNLETLNLTKVKESKGLSYENFSNLDALIDGSRNGGLEKLKALYCRENDIPHIPEGISRLKNLRLLDLRESYSLKKIHPNIGQLKQLQILLLTASRGLKKLPSEIGQLRNLKNLHLNYCHLTELPAEIGNLANLETLQLREAKLSSLPESISGLHNVRHFDLSSNNLNEIPESIGSMKNLRVIRLDQNKLLRLPDSISNCESLCKLQLNQNQLQSLPQQIGNLKWLGEIDVRGNQIDLLPASIGDLKSLSRLDISGQKLNFLPNSIGNLVNLEFLNLCGNQLTELPESLGNLRKLSTLGLGGNQLNALPASFSKLSKLDTLDLAGNIFSGRLPSSVRSLPLLNEVWVDDQVLKNDELAQYKFGARVLKQSLPNDNQLKLPPFVEGTGPSERVRQSIDEMSNYSEAKFVYRTKNEAGKVKAISVDFNKIPDGEAYFEDLKEIDGLVIVFNQFIPLPEWKINERFVYFTTNDSSKNEFHFGWSDNEDLELHISIKRTSKQGFIFKNFAYEFKFGSIWPGSASFSARKHHSIASLGVYGSNNPYSAELARDFTRIKRFDDSSPPLFSYFAPKGQTPWQAITAARQKVALKDEQYKQQIKEHVLN